MEFKSWNDSVLKCSRNHYSQGPVLSSPGGVYLCKFFVSWMIDLWVCLSFFYSLKKVIFTHTKWQSHRSKIMSVNNLTWSHFWPFISDKLPCLKTMKEFFSGNISSWSCYNFYVSHILYNSATLSLWTRKLYKVIQMKKIVSFKVSLQSPCGPCGSHKKLPFKERQKNITKKKNPLLWLQKTKSIEQPW